MKAIQIDAQNYYPGFNIPFHLESFEDYSSAIFSLKLKAFMAGNKETFKTEVNQLKPQTIKVPVHLAIRATPPVYKTWWDMFKDEHLPRWFLSRFPVEFKYPQTIEGIESITLEVGKNNEIAIDGHWLPLRTVPVTITAETIYPEIQIPEHKHFIHFTKGTIE